jgi:hypothetical protein
MNTLQKYLKKVTYFFNEESGEYLPSVDRIAEFKRMNKIHSAKAFKKDRLKRIKGKSVRYAKAPAPAGGRVGYGIFYTPQFQHAFTNFACIDYGIIVPPRAGGNSMNFLYLTATNGTAKGVEALISFKGQTLPIFRIFDWSMPENNRWSLSIPVNQLSNNFATVIINGINHRSCRILNKTEQTGAGVWENKVCLFNFSNTQWDIVYKRSYQSTVQAQHHDHFVSWGPIVETFQQRYTNLNAMGFFNAKLFNDAKTPPLTSQNSTIRDDPNDGVDVDFIETHSTFLVK